MAKAPSSVIGLDVGRYAIKCVQLQRRGEGRFAVTHYATRQLDGATASSAQLGTTIRDVLKQMGSARAFAVAVSAPEALVRIIEQPEMPPEILRNALRLNGANLLNQDCREFVLDCDKISASGNERTDSGQQRYVVGGMPRRELQRYHEALDGTGSVVNTLQLAPISLFNAFEFSHPEIFSAQAFFLIDIGHLSSTMILGSKRELVLVRSVEVGGHSILETLSAMSGEPRESVLIALAQQDEMMLDNVRVAMMNLTREVSSSIGFFEGRREEAIPKIHVSGGPAKSQSLLRVMSDELRIPCEPWNPFDPCDVSLPSRQRAGFPAEMFDLHVACGAAAELLNPH
ncbi:MAG: pilus assembly protein PilM [Chthoniobacteraceae bacterium]